MSVKRNPKHWNCIVPNIGTIKALTFQTLVLWGSPIVPNIGHIFKYSSYLLFQMLKFLGIGHKEKEELVKKGGERE